MDDNKIIFQLHDEDDPVELLLSPENTEVFAVENNDNSANNTVTLQIAETLANKQVEDFWNKYKSQLNTKNIEEIRLTTLSGTHILYNKIIAVNYSYNFFAQTRAPYSKRLIFTVGTDTEGDKTWQL